MDLALIENDRRPKFNRLSLAIPHHRRFPIVSSWERLPVLKGAGLVHGVGVLQDIWRAQAKLPHLEDGSGYGQNRRTKV